MWPGLRVGLLTVGAGEVCGSLCYLFWWSFPPAGLKAKECLISLQLDTPRPADIHGRPSLFLRETLEEDWMGGRGGVKAQGE